VSNCQTSGLPPGGPAGSRYQDTARHSHQAAQALGLWPSILYAQLAQLEHACGGPLIHRNHRPQRAGTPTPLGQQLRRQARDYLGLQPSPRQQTVQETSAR
jgi:DNA-binding transcriptional LysR family regulator